MGVESTKKISMFVVSDSSGIISMNMEYIKRLANVSKVEFIKNKLEISLKAASIVIPNAEIYIPLGELVDKEKETLRLNKEVQVVDKEITRGLSMLNNQGFLAKAPKELVSSEQEKLEINKNKLKKLKKMIDDLNQI